LNSDWHSALSFNHFSALQHTGNEECMRALPPIQTPRKQCFLYYVFFLSTLLTLGRGLVAQADTLNPHPAVSSSTQPASRTVTDELLKNFMAGLTYTPQPVALPEAPPSAPPPPPDSATRTPIASTEPTSAGSTLAPDADSDGTDADTDLPEPILPKTSPSNKKSPAPKPGRLSFMKPVLNAIVSSNFGLRWGRMHEGVDLAVPSGTPIHAAERGTVRFSGWSTGYGNLVIIDHGNGVTTRYGHASKLLVHRGQSVKKGQTIALVGSTGHSTGPHLHFEIRTQNAPQNPLGLIEHATPVAAHTASTRVQ
jgi:murein DD-endopeptidase MepM/ murein hydrolase activator NlpD